MQKIVLIGMKSSGKTTVGRLLAERLGGVSLDIDREIEKQHRTTHQEDLHFRDIYIRYGKEYFRSLESHALTRLAHELRDACFVLSTGGGTPLDERNQARLRSLGTVVFLDIDAAVLLPRITAGGVPAFFPYPDDPARSLAEVLAARRPIYRRLADMTITFSREPPEMLAARIEQALLEVSVVKVRPSRNHEYHE
jgi:shikimate kinase